MKIWSRAGLVTAMVGAVIGSFAVAAPAQAATAPSVPTAVSATSAGTSATLTWQPPATTGGTPVQAYELARDGVDSAGQGAWSGRFSASTRSGTFTSLVAGRTYNLSVRAINAAGAGAKVTMRVVAGRGQVVVPSAPTKVSAAASGTSATLTWAAPAADGNSTITGYRVGRDGTDSSGAGAWSGTVAADARSAVFGLLRPGATYTLSVAALNAVGTGPAATVKVSVSPSGVAMPVGDIAGWKQVFTEDFTSTVALGSWPGVYDAKWDDYTDPTHQDTGKGGVWNSKADISASGGAADYYLHSVNGVPQSAALVPNLPQPMTRGRYSVRFKVDAGLKDWASAWLLWPDDDTKWPDHGEMDFPEGELTGTMNAFTHYANPEGGQDQFDTGVSFATGWHTATTEWTTGQVRYLLDGKVIGTATTQVGNYPMHWVLQSETAYGHVPTSSGHIKIDWVAVYTPAG